MIPILKTTTNFKSANFLSHSLFDSLTQDWSSWYSEMRLKDETLEDTRLSHKWHSCLMREIGDETHTDTNTAIVDTVCWKYVGKQGSCFRCTFRYRASVHQPEPAPSEVEGTQSSTKNEGPKRRVDSSRTSFQPDLRSLFPKSLWFLCQILSPHVISSPFSPSTSASNVCECKQPLGLHRLVIMIRAKPKHIDKNCKHCCQSKKHRRESHSQIVFQVDLKLLRSLRTTFDDKNVSFECNPSCDTIAYSIPLREDSLSSQRRKPCCWCNNKQKLQSRVRKKRVKKKRRQE